jgi:uncharacterized protein
VRILAIDGGGIRGLIPALVLGELEQRSGRRTADLFDLIAGTSTGGILACALTRPRPRAADELVGLYRTEGPKIFHRTPWQIVKSGIGLLDEKYDDTALNEALHTYLGEDRLADCSPRILVTSYDLEQRTPKFFKSWREEDAGYTLSAVARASSGAPTYFEPLKLGDMALVDGGVFATDPAMCAYAEAERLEPGGDHVLVSLGTGQLTKPIHYEDAKGWGLIEWVRPVIDIVFDGVSDTVDYQLRELLDPRYHRFQTALTGGAKDALDDASPQNLERLAALAHELVKTSSAELDAVLEQLGRPGP